MKHRAKICPTCLTQNEPLVATCSSCTRDIKTVKLSPVCVSKPAAVTTTGHAPTDGRAPLPTANAALPPPRVAATRAIPAGNPYPDHALAHITTPSLMAWELDHSVCRNKAGEDFYDEHVLLTWLDAIDPALRARANAIRKKYKNADRDLGLSALQYHLDHDYRPHIDDREITDLQALKQLFEYEPTEAGVEFLRSGHVDVWLDAVLEPGREVDRLKGKFEGIRTHFPSKIWFAAHVLTHDTPFIFNRNTYDDLPELVQVMDQNDKEALLVLKNLSLASWLYARGYLEDEETNGLLDFIHSGSMSDALKLERLKWMLDPSLPKPFPVTPKEHLRVKLPFKRATKVMVDVNNGAGRGHLEGVLAPLHADSPFIYRIVDSQFAGEQSRLGIEIDTRNLAAGEEYKLPLKAVSTSRQEVPINISFKVKMPWGSLWGGSLLSALVGGMLCLTVRGCMDVLVPSLSNASLGTGHVDTMVTEAGGLELFIMAATLLGSVAGALCLWIRTWGK